MHHGEGEYEVNRSLHVPESHGGWRYHTGVDAAEQASPSGAALQTRDHPGFNVDRDNPAGRADEAGQVQREETHSGARLQHRHSGPDIRRQDPGWVMKEPPQRAGRKVASPPRADAVIGHSPVS